MKTDRDAKAAQLKALHHGSRPLVLVNAWDAASAKILEGAGFPAIATTSAGIAFSRGYPDGERMPLDSMLESVALISKAVSLPVTADMEAGYGDSPEEVARTTEGVIQAGAVGLNLEDGTGRPADPLVELSLQLEKLRAVKEAATQENTDIVLNARTDAYLRGVGSAKEQLEETIRRAEAYRDAGADCIFIPGLSDKKVISDLVERLHFPINILAVAGGPTIPELKALGVARVSFGSGPARAALTLLQQIATEALTHGTYSLLESIIPHAKMNEMMTHTGR